MRVTASAAQRGLPSSHPCRRFLSSVLSPSNRAPVLSWKELYYASRLARWSGYLYLPADQIPARLKAEGLEVVAQGSLPFTSYIICEGAVDYTPLLDAAKRSLEAEGHLGPHALGSGPASTLRLAAAAVAAGKGAEAWQQQPASSSSSSNDTSSGQQQRHHQVKGSQQGHSQAASSHAHGHAHAHVHGHSQHSSTHARSPRSSHHHGHHHADPHVAHAVQGAHGSGATHAASHSSTAHSLSLGNSATYALNHHHHHHQSNHHAQHPGIQELLKAPAPERRRYVFLRGVHWNAPDINVTRVSTALMNFLPSPFAPTQTQPYGALVAHTGVGQLAYSLFRTLLPFLQGSAAGSTQAHPQQSQPAGRGSGAPSTAVPSGSDAKSQGKGNSNGGSSKEASTSSSGSSSSLPLSFVGHSLGGALGMLLLALCSLNRTRAPGALSVHCFGSPPVLSHKDGGGGHRVLEVLGCSDDSVRSFVLEHDPVPRALITADPAFTALKEYGPVRQLLQARSWLLGTLSSLSATSSTSSVDEPAGPRQGSRPGAGAGPASGGTGHGSASGSAAAPGLNGQGRGVGAGDGAPVTHLLSNDRFVFEPVGSVYLMKSGGGVVPLGPAALTEELLRMSPAEVLSQPARVLQAWLDHHHSSYSADLESAALAALRRELRTARKAASGAAAAAAAPAAPAPAEPGIPSPGASPASSSDDGAAAASGTKQPVA